MENINHCCMGDMLRTERDRPDSPWAEQIQHQMREGGLVRPELSVELLESYISQAINASNKRIILDGFPRSIEQAVLFEQKVRYHRRLIRRGLSAYTLKIGYCTAAVSLQCPKDVMIGRLLKRQETSGRIDDNLEVFEKRYKGYLKDTMPVIEHLKMAETRLVEVSERHIVMLKKWLNKKRFLQRRMAKRVGSDSVPH